VVSLLLVAEVPDSSDERGIALRASPSDGLGLGFGRVQDMIGLIFDDEVLDGAMHVVPFGAWFNKDIGHRFLREHDDPW
jgi:hypothetical protein